MENIQDAMWDFYFYFKSVLRLIYSIPKCSLSYLYIETMYMVWYPTRGKKKKRNNTTSVLSMFSVNFTMKGCISAQSGSTISKDNKKKLPLIAICVCVCVKVRVCVFTTHKHVHNGCVCVFMSPVWLVCDLEHSAPQWPSVGQVSSLPSPPAPLSS